MRLRSVVMAAGALTLPSLRAFRARKLQLASLGVAGLSVLVAACSASPGESAESSESALSGTIKPMLGWESILTVSSSDGQIVNGNGGCLDLPGGNTTNGTLLHIWACDTSGWNQTWYVDAKGSIHYAADPTKCVDFPAQSLVNGVPTDETQLQIWDCNGASGPDQVWHPTITGNIQFGADTSKCVELRDGSSANNTPVQIYDCNGTSGQTWKLEEFGTSVQGFQLQDANGACLQPASATAGAALVLERCNGSVADQQWGLDGTSAGLFNYALGQSVTFPSQDITPTTFVPETQLVLANENFSQGQGIALSSSSHTMVIGGLACVEARNGSAANGTVVQGYTCNGTSGQTWFAKPVGGTCPGTVLSDGACEQCGTAGGAPCAGTQVGCNAGLVSANVYAGTPMGNTTTQACVSACGSIGQLPCASGPMGYNTGLGSDIEQAQAGQSLGGCTEQDAVILWKSGSNLCQWPVTCGHAGESCCDAGDIGQTSSSSTDLCHDGSTPTYVLFYGWQCVAPAGGGGGGGTGCTESDYQFYEVCDGICEGLPVITQCSEALALQAAQKLASCAAVYEGSCP